MSMMHERPDSIRWQIGRSFEKIRECIDQEQPGRLLNHVELLVALVEPKLVGLTEEKRKGLQLAEVDLKRDFDGKEARKAFRSALDVIRALTPILSENGLYSWTAPRPGDGSGLKPLRAGLPAAEDDDELREVFVQ